MNEYDLKKERWLVFAKNSGVKKWEAWPFWMYVLNCFDMRPTPPLFWNLYAVFAYYFLFMMICFIVLFTYFTAFKLDVESAQTLLMICVPLALLMTYSTSIKKRNLKITTWNEF